MISYWKILQVTAPNIIFCHIYLPLTIFWANVVSLRVSSIHNYHETALLQRSESLTSLKHIWRILDKIQKSLCANILTVWYETIPTTIGHEETRTYVLILDKTCTITLVIILAHPKFFGSDSCIYLLLWMCQRLHSNLFTNCFNEKNLA